MAHELHKVRVRAALANRKEPYWGPGIADDLTLGYRKVGDDEGYWTARWRRSDPAPKQRRYEEHPLGLATSDNDYEAARTAALEWRKGKLAGVVADHFTVIQACKEYVENREREKGVATAKDSRQRFERCVYSNPIAHIPLERLKAPMLMKWLSALKLSAASEKRTLSTLRAALNLAVKNRRAHPAAKYEWGSDVASRKVKDSRRSLFLDRTQRRALLSRLQGALHDLVEAAALTGARAGELTSAKRGQFDKRVGLMTFTGKTGSRIVPLSPVATALFDRLAESKLPAAYLFVRSDPGESNGKPWAHSDWDDLIVEAAQLAKLPAGVCLYTLRHSFITEALLGGIPTLEVARLVGTSVTMIERHYGHLVADAARKRLATVQML